MSGLKILDVHPIDPNLKTGPSRIMSGPVRMRAVTPDTAYGEFATWLYCGVAGNVSVVQWDGTTIVLTGLVAGVWHPIYSIMINSSGTTATNLVWAS
jgi:hypothetical protein